MVAGLVCAIATAALVACSRGESPDPTLKAFLDGWRSGKLDGVGFVTPASQGVSATQVSEEIKALSGDLAQTPPGLRVSKKPKVSKDLAVGEVTVSWPVGSGVTWEYASPVQLARDQGKWRMVWSPAVVHPQLTAGDKLGVRRTAAPRGSILDGAGNPIVQDRKVVDIGVEKQKVTNLPGLIKQLDAAFKSINQTVDMSDLSAKVAAAKPDAFNYLITLRWETYERIRYINAYDGTVFIERMAPLAPTREWARALLGTVGDVTKEIMDANPGKYSIGDQVGLGGLQRQYDDRLRGVPGVTVVVTRTAADGTVTKNDLWKADPKPGTPLKITLDPKVQTAADDALKAQPKKSAIVAVRATDGGVLAVANGPDGGTTNLALTGRVPPGSTYKMVTSLGLLDAGAVTLDGVVPCPKTKVIDGYPVKNSHDFELGDVPFRVDFAKSCNTAFASLGDKLGDTGLAEASKTVGIGIPWDLGVDAFTGSVSTGGSAAERAAAAFGQGKTVVSPISLAAAAAAVQHGQWQQPKLLLDPAPTHPASPGPQLKQSTVDGLRTMMGEVVTKGTGVALADVPGGAVYGKTGTAEFDNNPAHAHAWFIGWQGDIAFAVFVENGGDSTSASVPLAETFLRNLTR